MARSDCCIERNNKLPLPVRKKFSLRLTGEINNNSLGIFLFLLFCSQKTCLKNLPCCCFFFPRLFAELYCAQFYCIFPELLLLLYSYLFCRHLWNFNSHVLLLFRICLALTLTLAHALALSRTQARAHTVRTCARTRTLAAARSLSHASRFVLHSNKATLTHSLTQLHLSPFCTHFYCLPFSPCGFSRLAAHLILFCRMPFQHFLLSAFFL